MYGELHADLPTLSPTAAPLFSETPVDMMADVGENVTLPCVAHGFPLPKVTWRRDDGRPIPTNVDSSGSHVQLEKGHLLIQSESLCPFPTILYNISLSRYCIPYQSSRLQRDQNLHWRQVCDWHG